MKTARHFEINSEVITETHFKDERLKIDGTSLVLTREGDPPMRCERQ